MGEVLVRMEGIEKSFPGVHALSDAQFELRTGEVHALVGENGAGKSTLMKILAGVYAKDAGRIIYKGAGVSIPNPRAAQDLGISMIHQELNLMPHLTIAQNIFIGREPRAGLPFVLDEKGINDKALKLFDMMHLKLDPRAKVADLTVAKQQMVEIAKSLSFNSDVLIMDEPTAALTERRSSNSSASSTSCASQGVGIVHISHRLEELKQISDRITVMRDGRTIDTINTKEVTHRPHHQHDGRSHDLRGRARNARSAQPGSGTGSAQPEPRQCHQGRQLPAQEGRNPGPGRAGGRGAHGGGTRHLWRRPHRLGRGTGQRQAGPHPLAPRRSAAGIAYLSEDRKRYGLALGMDVESNIVLATLGKFLRALGWIDTARTREIGECARRVAGDQDARAGSKGSRTCPAATSRRSSSANG